MEIYLRACLSVSFDICLCPPLSGVANENIRKRAAGCDYSMLAFFHSIPIGICWYQTAWILLFVLRHLRDIKKLQNCHQSLKEEKNFEINENKATKNKVQHTHKLKLHRENCFPSIFPKPFRPDHRVLHLHTKCMRGSVKIKSKYTTQNSREWACPNYG